MEWSWSHPPESDVENDGESEEYHGRPAACLGDACKDRHGGPVQHWPLWMIPELGPHQLGDRPKHPKGSGLNREPHPG